MDARAGGDFVAVVESNSARRDSEPAPDLPLDARVQRAHVLRRVRRGSGVARPAAAARQPVGAAAPVAAGRESRLGLLAARIAEIERLRRWARYGLRRVDKKGTGGITCAAKVFGMAAEGSQPWFPVWA